jgi:hypothetical protein
MDHTLRHAVATPRTSSLALSATTHCLTGCVIGEVAGMVIGTAAAWSDMQTIALAVTLAFVFGYALTMLPLVRAGTTLTSAAGAALASDTVSIAVMETIDNLAMVMVPGAMDAGLDSPLFWGTLAGGLTAAFPLAFAVNYYLLKRGFARADAHSGHRREA